MTSGWKRPLALAGACWGAFALLVVAAYWLPVARWADGWAVESFRNLESPRLDPLAWHVAKLADPLPFALATVALAAIALRRGRPRHALAVIVLLVGANAVTQTLKLVLEHPRYHDFFGAAQLGADAFPSGHATAAMSLAFAAVLVAPVALRPLVAVLGALFALGVSESIMLLAWHFPSDVAGGFLVATASTLVTIAALRAAEQRWPERTGREAAKRVIGDIDSRRAAEILAGFVAVVGLAVLLAAGERAASFADRHTVAAIAVVVVGAMSAALPVSVAALGARRS
jgi:membrane-associated phospholipid phosphatase